MGGAIAKTEKPTQKNPISTPGSSHPDSTISPHETLDPFAESTAKPSVQWNPRSGIQSITHLGFSEDSYSSSSPNLLPSVQQGQLKDPYAETKLTQATFIISGSAAVLTGALIWKYSDSGLNRGIGSGLIFAGGASLTYDLLDKLDGGKTMPRWYKTVGAAGVGIIGGLAMGFFGGGFNPGGVSFNPDRNPTDEYGP